MHINQGLGPCSVSTYARIFFFLLVVAYLWFSLNKVVDLLRPQAALIHMANYVYGLYPFEPFCEKTEGNT